MAQHKKTKKHMAWETTLEVKDVRVQSKHYENEIERLKNRLEHKERVETELLHRIHQLESDLQYWKKVSEDVYV
jgi:chromosome segregation ATPase